MLFAIENVAELKPKIPEVKEAIRNLGDFISSLRKMTVLLDINLPKMDEQKCSGEIDNVKQFNRNSNEGVQSLIKKARGWLA